MELSRFLSRTYQRLALIANGGSIDYYHRRSYDRSSSSTGLDDGSSSPLLELKKSESSNLEVEEEIREVKTQRRNRSNRRRTLAIISLTLIILVSFTISALYTFKRLKKSKGSERPIQIFVKSNSQNQNPKPCEVPYSFTRSEADADVIVWPNPESQFSNYNATRSREERPWQLNAFWSLESAGYYPQLENARKNLGSGGNQSFDLEITYRTKSDVPIPYAYSFINLRQKPLSFEDRRQDKIAAAFISNCGPMNNRTEVFKELIKLLPNQIDSFGGCQSNADSHEFLESFGIVSKNVTQKTKRLSRWDEKMEIIKRYKFTIAFENTDEEDYVTEKYYQALSAGSIPIHLGLTTEQFQKFKPSSNSALNVGDFKDLKELASKMKEISNDKSKFDEMLSWKNVKFDKDFESIVGFGKVHEYCRVAMLIYKKWSNPFAVKPERYDSLFSRLKLRPKNQQQEQKQS